MSFTMAFSGLSTGATYRVRTWHNDSYSLNAGFAAGGGTVPISASGATVVSSTSGTVTNRRGAQTDSAFGIAAMTFIPSVRGPADHLHPCGREHHGPAGERGGGDGDRRPGTVRKQCRGTRRSGRHRRLEATHTGGSEAIMRPGFGAPAGVRALTSRARRHRLKTCTTQDGHRLKTCATTELERGAVHAPKPGSGSQRSQDGEAQRTGSERMPRRHPRTSGSGAWADPSGGLPDTRRLVEGFHTG